MSRTSRLAALILGLLLVWVIGGVLCYLGYAKYRLLHREPIGDGYLSVPAQYVAGAAFFDKFKGPLIGSFTLGLGLVLLAAFRKEPSESTPSSAEPIDPLAD